jgi:ABC-2 type transport system ATP-binding protein
MTIDVRELTKVYQVPVREPGLWSAVRSLFHREYRDVRAVDGVSFHIEPGERVGFLGPNGAGKTTTLKMLTGLLHPTSGSCSVLGMRPGDRPRELLEDITLVMGQKQQLFWDLAPTETFLVNRAMYGLEQAAWQEAVDEMVELLQLSSFLDQPVRNLSLGQRMRCELASALLHRPKVLFLDEPTIGLDVEVQALVRQFIKTYNERHGATVVLTSHDMNDVSAIVDRVLLIDSGTLCFDGGLDELATRFGSGRVLSVRGAGDLSDLGLVEQGGRWETTADPESINQLLTAILHRAPGADVTVSDPQLEDVLRAAFGAQR